jgi:hypothetical protein
VYLPEFSQDFFTVGFVLGFVFRRFKALRKPAFLVKPEQLFEGGGGWCADFKEAFDAGMQRGAETEIPLGGGLEPINVLQFIAPGA